MPPPFLISSIFERMKSSKKDTKSGDDFLISGPSLLRSVNWSNEDHRRIVAACLVKGVYVTKRDRSLAERWWKNFHFEKKLELKDEEENKFSIFGVVYEYKPPASNSDQSMMAAPRYIIAFRGTDPFSAYDVNLDFQLLLKKNLSTRRFAITEKTVWKMVDEVGASNIWLTGHSLGSSIAMQIGKNMASLGVLLQAYLFNPPFVSFPTEKIIMGLSIEVTEMTKQIGYFLKAVAIRAATTSSQMSKIQNDFYELSPWIPRLFVNGKDLICSGYIHYFEEREKEKSPRIQKAAEISSQISTVNTYYNHFSESNKSTAVHLLPSAELFKNSGAKEDPHAIRQWWSPDLNLDCQKYQYRRR